MSIFLGVLSLSIIGFLLHIWFTRESLTKFRVVELLLLYQLVFCVGFASLLGWIGQGFMMNTVASLLGWPESPFQIELANVNLGYGVLGIMSIWYRGYFWLATIIGFSVWLIADGIHHIVDAEMYRNFSIGNIGIPMYTDFLVPIVLLILLGFYFKLAPSSAIPVESKGMRSRIANGR